MESTHITAGRKLEKLFGLVVLAFLFSFGCHLRAQGLKTNAASKRKSLFRLGLVDILRRLQPSEKQTQQTAELRQFYDWLTSPVFKSIFLV